jgi:hypothetical protein
MVSLEHRLGSSSKNNRWATVKPGKRGVAKKHRPPSLLRREEAIRHPPTELGSPLHLNAGSIGPWKYSSIRKWDFFWPGFPVVAYFKEDETRPEGRRHVFFVIADGKALYTEMMSRFGARKDLPRVEEWDDLRPLSPKGYRRAVSRLMAAAQQFERDMRMMERLRAIAASVNDRLARSRFPLVGKAVALLGSLAAAFGQALGKVTGSAPGRGTDP